MKTKIKANIDQSACAGCQTCYLNCPQEVIHYIKKGFLSIGYCQVDEVHCIGCGTCSRLCITGAVMMLLPFNEENP